ncbi:hypothetical protein SAMN05421753_12436 [Planctomicrobium piriforme]|uniref:Uncharacterized protein n=1 Tax=Planctomicrobium piriforme TaxID=1576369 RepID=A0A1I3SHL5_9PLAN|nr:hypothetical protein SAMN05421753_12436 [Planctomicrobium piriforme]
MPFANPEHDKIPLKQRSTGALLFMMLFFAVVTIPSILFTWTSGETILDWSVGFALPIFCLTTVWYRCGQELVRRKRQSHFETR